MTASTNVLKMVRERGYHWVTQIKPLEGSAVLLPCPGQNLEMILVEVEESLFMRYNTIPYQDLHANSLVQGVVYLFKIK